jgi:CheY-like chemotaxis protein
MKLQDVLLIADDKPTNSLNQIVLKRAECTETIICKQDAQSALQYLSKSQEQTGRMPALILLDINMPGMSGWDFLEEYGKLPDAARSTSKVIMTTTSLNPDDEVRAKNNPYIEGYCKKPLTTAKLSVLLETYFTK